MEGVGQRAMAAASDVADRGMPREEAAKKHGISESTVRRAVFVLTDASLAEAVSRGEVSVRSAYLKLRRTVDPAPEAGGPGRGHVGPRVVLLRQAALPELRLVQSIFKDWELHRSLVKTLPAHEVQILLRDLRDSRSATTRLIRLIEEET